MIRSDRLELPSVEESTGRTATLAKPPALKRRGERDSVLADQASASRQAEEENSGETKREAFAPIGRVLDSCKSWAISMCIHLAAIVLLALFSLSIPHSDPVSLVVDSDQGQSLSFVDELVLDTTNWDALSPTTTEEPLPEVPELLQWDSADELDKTPLVSKDLMQAGLASLAAIPDLARLRGGSKPSFFGIEATGNRIVYVVDRSGSMDGDRWFDAREEIVDSIEQLTPDQEFFIYLFSRQCHPMPNLAGARKMIPATEDNVRKTKDWLFKQIPDGHTYPLASIKKALQMEADTIFLLTDGNFQDDTGRYLIDRAVLRQSTSETGGVVINTIAFHCEVGLEMLKQVAVANSGTFRHVGPSKTP